MPVRVSRWRLHVGGDVLMRRPSQLPRSLSMVICRDRVLARRIVSCLNRT